MLLRIPLEDIGAVPPNRGKARSWPSRRSSRPSRCRGGFLCGTRAGRSPSARARAYRRAHPVLPARPMRKRRLLRLRARSSSPSSRTALSAVLSAMRMPAALRNVSATRRYPYLNRDFSHIPAMAGRSAACLSEGGSPRGGNRRSAASRWTPGARRADIPASATSPSRASACRREGRRRGGRSS